MESQLIDINWYSYVVETDTFLDLFILLTMVKYPKMACFISALPSQWVQAPQLRAAIVEFDFQLLRFLVSKYCFLQLLQFALSKTYSPHVKSKRPWSKLKSVSD